MTPYGAAIFGVEGLRLSAQEKAFFRAENPFGFILFNRNIDSADQLRALTAGLRDCVGWRVPIFIDQEGGRVQRLRPPLASEWLPALDDVARFAPQDVAQAIYLRYRIISAELMSYGIDGNCAPLLDVAREDTHAVLKNRCYGSDLNSVVKIAKAVAQGCLDGGVLPVIKHMPGHGLGTLDSHLELPRITATRETLDDVDFSAFAQVNDLPLGMTGHLVFEAIDPRATTVSPVMIDLIRSQIGFDGLLMTDDLSMEALQGTVAQRASDAISAGCDVILHCNGKLDEMQQVVENAGQMTAQAQARAQAALACRRDPGAVDIDALKAEFHALIPA